MSAGWTCLRAEPEDGETVQEVCARLKLPFSPGAGYYQLIKSEKISANKELAMLRVAANAWVVGGPATRKALKLKAGAITVKPADLPPGVELFVQSTSNNRKLTSKGTLLLRFPNDAVAATAAARATVIPAPKGKMAAPKVSGSVGKARKLDHDGNPVVKVRTHKVKVASVGPRPVKRPRDTGRTSAVDPDSSPLDWTPFTGQLVAIEEEGLDEESLVKANPGDYEHCCDEEPPAHLVDNAIEWLALLLREAGDWVVRKKDQVQLSGRYSPSRLRRFHWHSDVAAADLMYLELKGSTLLLVSAEPAAATSEAVQEKEDPFALATGSAMGHPLIHSQHFLYANSDGSSSDRNLGDRVNPTLVLAKFIHDVALHASNSEH